MSGLRSRACQIANELAREHGGKPSDYMGEAWDIVRGDKLQSTPKRTRYNPEEKGGNGKMDWVSLAGKAAKVVGTKLAKSTVQKGNEKIKSGAKSASRNLDFTKPPKDSPSEVFSGLNKMLTKRPDKIELPSGVRNEVKRMFRFW